MGLGRSTHRSELVPHTTGRVPCRALCLCRGPASSHTPMGYTPIVQMRKQTQGGSVTCIRPGREMAEPRFETQSESTGFAGQTFKAAPSTPDPSQGLPSEVAHLPRCPSVPGLPPPPPPPPCLACASLWFSAVPATRLPSNARPRSWAGECVTQLYPIPPDAELTPKCGGTVASLCLEKVSVSTCVSSPTAAPTDSRARTHI